MPAAYDIHAYEDGDTVDGVEFIHTPGHTKEHTSIAYGKTLLLNDLLLPTYTPNADGSDTCLCDPLGASLTSIDWVAARYDHGEPGHGTTMNVRKVVNAVRSHHRKRATSAFRTLETGNGTTPWSVARTLFGEMDSIHVKFGAGEAAVHLKRLAALNVVERFDGDIVRYQLRLENYPVGLNLTP